MLADALARLRERAAAASLPNPAGRLGRAGRPCNDTAFRLPAEADPLGRAGRTYEREPDHPCGLPSTPDDAGRPKSQQNQASPQSPRSPRENKHSGAAARPRWDDVSGWRQIYGGVHDLEAKREIARQRALAAGGLFENDVVILPPGLPSGLALAELKTQAMIAGLKVVERAMACAWCPNTALPGDALCEHCRWLGGARP